MRNRIRLPSRRQMLLELLGLIASMGAALAGFFAVSRMNPSNLSGLWGKNDAILEYAMAQLLASGPGTMFTDRLGFPVGQDWSHFPSLDPLTRGEVFLLTQFTDPVTTMNLLIVLSFPLVSGMMYLALRNLQVHRFVAIVGGFALAMLGYHFDYEHPILSNYYAVAVGIFWLSVVMGVPSILTSKAGSRAILITGVLAGLVVGWQTPYYTVFFLILGGIAFAFRFRVSLARPSTTTRLVILAVPALALGLSIVFTRLLRIVPSTEAAAQRSVEESFTWAGQLASLFTVSGTSLFARNPVNAPLQDALDTTAWTGLTANHNTLVVIASGAMAVTILFTLFRPPRMPHDERSALGDVQPWAGLWLVGAAFFVTSGLGIIFAALVTPQIRGWSRLGVIIAALALTGGALILSRLIADSQRWSGWRSPVLRIGILALTALLAIDAVTDSRPIESDTQRLPSLASMLSSQGADAGAGTDCPILQLPLISFPEAFPKGGMQGYDHLLPSLASETERFSYGAIFGQLGSRWSEHLSVQPAALASEAAALGFCRVLIDAVGLDETSPSLQQYQEAMGAPLATVENRWYLFSLDGISPDPTASNIFIRPEVDYAQGFTDGQMTEDAVFYRWITGNEATLRVWNPDATARGWVMELPISAPSCQPMQRLQVSIDGVPYETMALADAIPSIAAVPVYLPAQSFVDVDLTPELPGCSMPSVTPSVRARLEHPSFRAASEAGLLAIPATGFWPQESDGVDTWQWSSEPEGLVRVFNTNAVPAQVSFKAQIQAPPCGGPLQVAVSVDGERRESVSLLPGESKEVSVSMNIAPSSEAELTLMSTQPGCSVGDDERVLGPGIRNPRTVNF